MKSFSRLLLPWPSPAAAWQGAAEAIEGTENAHKEKEKITLTLLDSYTTSKTKQGKERSRHSHLTSLQLQVTWCLPYLPCFH